MHGVTVCAAIEKVCVVEPRESLLVSEPRTFRTTTGSEFYR